MAYTSKLTSSIALGASAAMLLTLIGCASKPPAPPEPAPAPVVETRAVEVKPEPAPEPPPPPKPVARKITLSTDTHFDFDKSVLRTEGKAKLDELVGKTRDVTLEVITAVGHTCSIGSDTYNQKLSVRRADSVKTYLVSKGIPASRIYTEGKGEKQPTASNKTKEGREKNRRVELEVIGTTTN